MEGRKSVRNQFGNQCTRRRTYQQPNIREHLAQVHPTYISQACVDLMVFVSPDLSQDGTDVLISDLGSSIWMYSRVRRADFRFSQQSSRVRNARCTVGNRGQ